MDHFWISQFPNSNPTEYAWNRLLLSIERRAKAAEGQPYDSKACQLAMRDIYPDIISELFARLNILAEKLKEK